MNQRTYSQFQESPLSREQIDTIYNPIREEYTTRTNKIVARCNKAIMAGITISTLALPALAAKYLNPHENGSHEYQAWIENSDIATVGLFFLGLATILGSGIAGIEAILKNGKSRAAETEKAINLERLTSEPHRWN